MIFEFDHWVIDSDDVVLNKKMKNSWIFAENLQYFTGDECHFRLGIFLTNFRLIQEFNSNKKSYKVGLNRFSCYTSSEYKSLLGYKQISIQLKHQQYPKLNDDIPDFIN